MLELHENNMTTQHSTYNTAGVMKSRMKDPDHVWETFMTS